MRTRLAGRVVLAALAGYGPGQPTTPRTGAEEAARDNFEAVVRRDWLRAYDLLHTQSRSRYSAVGFARAAEAYQRGIGFDPEAVRVRSCEEQGEKARAHLVFEGKAGGRQKFFREATELRRTEAGWGVVLPPRFGR
jgi:hypothetical protein